MDIRGLGYVTVLSSDLNRWRDYATQVLGMMAAAGPQADELLYLKMDERPYRILVEKSTQDGYGACGWELAGKAAFEQALVELAQADVPVQRGSAAQAEVRKVQELACFSDPDGNRHELFWGPRQDFARFVSPVGVKGFVTSDLGMGHVVLPAPSFERGLMLRSPARFQETARRLVELYLANREQADQDPAIGEAVMRAYLDAEAYTLATYMTASSLGKGGKIGPESSTNKIFWSELDQRMHETAMSILGLRGELLPEAPDAGEVGHWLDGFLFAQAGPIYAGTNEIQRNIIAERMLGMPRA
ncbi:hypothetical protein HP532_09045 [Pseudomonas sp. CrR25]|nr:hypothetical protein [Pseudomonas sp. CrR25]